MCQQRAVQVVGHIGRHGADHVRRVNVLQREQLPIVLLRLPRPQLGLEPCAHIQEHRVAGLIVQLLLWVGSQNEALPSSLGDDDHGVAFLEAMRYRNSNSLPAPRR